MSLEYQPEWRRNKQDSESENQNMPPRPRARHNTSEDPDLLREIVAQTRRPTSEVQRITTQQIKALKVSSKKESGIFVGILRVIQGFFGFFIRAFTSVFCPQTPLHRSSQCDIYGHVVEKGWSGAYPKCQKCGAQVTSLDQLRSAIPKGRQDKR